MGLGAPNSLELMAGLGWSVPTKQPTKQLGLHEVKARASAAPDGFLHAEKAAGCHLGHLVLAALEQLVLCTIPHCFGE
jgi:hypothetical protein